MALLSLLLQAEPGDQNKVLAIYERYYKKLFNYTYSRLGSPEDTEDVVQTVFEHVLRDIHKVDAVDSPRTSGLLFLVTKRLIAKKRADNQKHAADRLDESLVDEPADLADPVWSQVAPRLSVESLARALKQLPEADYLLLVGRHLYGYSYRELAQRFGTTEKNISVRLSRLRRRLQAAEREEVAGYGADGS